MCVPKKKGPSRKAAISAARMRGPPRIWFGFEVMCVQPMDWLWHGSRHATIRRGIRTRNRTLKKRSEKAHSAHQQQKLHRRTPDLRGLALCALAYKWRAAMTWYGGLEQSRLSQNPSARSKHHIAKRKGAFPLSRGCAKALTRSVAGKFNYTNSESRQKFSIA